MDILYYSNYCKHSKSILTFLLKNNLSNSLNFICIDKKVRDSTNNQIYIFLEDGRKVLLPPNIHSVPALMEINKNYNIIYGASIVSHFESKIQVQNDIATKNNGEPFGYGLNQFSNIVSEKYTMYSMTPDELSAKGKGGERQMYNYVSATHDIINIKTPPDTYQPDKLSNEVTIDKIEQQRNSEIKI